MPVPQQWFLPVASGDCRDYETLPLKRKKFNTTMIKRLTQCQHAYTNAAHSVEAISTIFAEIVCTS